MQPLLHHEASEPVRYNPYCILRPRRPKTATPIAFWCLGATKIKSLQHFGASEAKKCNPYRSLGPRSPKKSNPYSILGPRKPKNATPTPVWGRGARKLQPLLHVGLSEPENATSFEKPKFSAKFCSKF